ncbi:flippase [Blautia sp. HCP3S3_G3]|uniref:flippase n=1 Tax=Blautia sp. HCP3S3_G3 TaxID=3438913 RepID=UPI003F8997A0
MIKRKSVKVNFIYNLVFQMFIYAVPLITTPYVSRILGAENIGHYSYAMSMVTYFTLIATLGTGTHGQRVTAYARNDTNQLNAAFWNTQTFRCITTIVGIVLYFVYLKVSNMSIGILEMIVVLNIINVAFDISWFFQGLEDFKQTAIRGLAVKIGGLLGIFLFVRDNGDTWKYALILLGSTFLGNLSLWRFLHKTIGLPKRIEPFHDLKDIVLVFLPTVATQVYMVLDKSMIGWITQSNYENGCYEQSEKIVRVLLMVISSVSAVMLPRIASLFSENNMEGIRNYIYKSYRVVWFLSIPFMFGLISVADIFMPLFLGPGYDMSVPLVIIFSWLFIVVGMASVTGLAYLVPTKQQNVYTASVSLAAIVNFIMNSFLIPKIGAYGAAIASITAETVGATFQIIFCIIKKQLQFKKIFVPSWKYVLSGAIMFVVLQVVKKQVGTGILSFSILVMTGIIVYVGMILILKDDIVYGFASNIFKRSS